jgi:hypothetical protein
MPCVIIGVKEWAAKNPEISVFKSTLMASNQMKNYEDWKVRAPKRWLKHTKLKSRILVQNVQRTTRN